MTQIKLRKVAPDSRHQAKYYNLFADSTAILPGTKPALQAKDLTWQSRANAMNH